MRQEPLLPTDLTLAKEALAILKTFPDFTLLVGVLGPSGEKGKGFLPVFSIREGYGAENCGVPAQTWEHLLFLKLR